MRVILSLVVVAFAMGTLACGNKGRVAKVRARGNLTETEYHAISELNAMLSDNDAALDYALKWDGVSADSPEAMISAKATALGKVLRGERRSGACASSTQEPGRDFSVGWSAKQTFSGASCPVNSVRTWKWDYRPSNGIEQMWLSHSFNVKPEAKAFLEAGGIKQVRASESRIAVIRRASTGTVTIQGIITYDLIQLASGDQLAARITTQQSYRGNSGNGTVSITLAQAGKWSRSGTITWKGSDFSDRTYAAEGGKMDRESFLQLFSFFRLDEIVDNSERMR
jgi:hypothetical protein